MGGWGGMAGGGCRRTGGKTPSLTAINASKQNNKTNPQKTESKARVGVGGGEEGAGGADQAVHCRLGLLATFTLQQ